MKAGLGCKHCTALWALTNLVFPSKLQLSRFGDWIPTWGLHTETWLNSCKYVYVRIDTWTPTWALFIESWLPYTMVPAGVAPAQRRGCLNWILTTGGTDKRGGDWVLNTNLGVVCWIPTGLFWCVWSRFGSWIPTWGLPNETWLNQTRPWYLYPASWVGRAQI
jgi:hypothetical protein